jgi:3-oxoacyl-[acyl-carrier-protein] synthase-1
MIDMAGEPMRLAIAPWLDINLMGVDRFKALLFPAIDQALASITETQTSPSTIALSLGIPCLRPGLPTGLESALAKALEETYLGVFSAVTLFPYGNAAGMIALEDAAKKLAQGNFDACVVAGVDSYIEPETLEWLDESDQLNGISNSWGFIPGEGAGAVLLVTANTARRCRLEPLAQVLGIGTAIEPNRINTNTICIGKGLTEAFNNTLAILPNTFKATDIYCDMNGEPYRANEYGFTCLRTSRAFESVSDFVAPADCLGDGGAASGPLYVVLATIAEKKRYSAGSFAFLWASSRSGLRAAVLLQRA